MLNKIRTKVKDVLEIAFFKSSFIYLVGNIANAIIPFSLLPVLTRYLSPADYGVVGTSLVLIQMLTLFIGFNASGLIARGQFDNDFRAHQKLMSTMIILSSILSIFFIILLTMTKRLVGNVTKFPSEWVAITVIIAFFGVIHSFYLILLQVRKEPKIFITIQILLTSLNLGIALLLVVCFGMNWQGRMLATIISGGIVATICLYGLAIRFKLLRMVFDTRSLKSLLSFGIPLIPHTIGGWVMMMVPRLYLNNMATIADTGLFSVGYNVASPIALVVGAANQAYMPELFSKLSNSESLKKLRLARILLLAAVFLMISAFVYGIFLRWFLPFIVGYQFYNAASYILWFALSFAMHGVYFIFANFVVYSKKTSLIAWRADFLGGITIIILCPLMIKLIGPIGASIAMFLSFTISTIGCFTASRKAYPMPWRKATFSLVNSIRQIKIKRKAPISPYKK